jgi:hypothetical protein
MKRLQTLPKSYLWLLIPAVIVLLLVLRFWFVAVLLLAVGAIVLGVWALARGSAPRIKSRQIGAGVLAAGALALVIGSGGVAAEMDSSPPADSVAASTMNPSESAAPRTTAPRTTPSAKPKPVQEVQEVEERSAVPFTSSTVDDGNLASGTTAVATAGANGERTVKYRVTYEDGVEISREVLSDVISVAPVNEVIARGTYVAPPPPPPAAPAENGCHPSYEGACVPFADDVDCAGGSGNGPAYVQGPLRVVGPDVYDLERDGDGIACDA